jgi:hypothetical protein
MSNCRDPWGARADAEHEAIGEALHDRHLDMACEGYPVCFDCYFEQEELEHEEGRCQPEFCSLCAEKLKWGARA